MLGPRGAFDEDAIPDDNDDEDLKDDPISRMDMTVSSRKFANISSALVCDTMFSNALSFREAHSFINDMRRA